MPIYGTDGALSVRKADTVVATSANTATQVIRIPWADPYNMKAKIKKIQATNVFSGSMVLYLWDADLSDTTPGTRGTGNVTSALLTIGVGAAPLTSGGATTVTLDEGVLPAIEIEAGVAIAANQLNAQVSVELEVY